MTKNEFNDFKSDVLKELFEAEGYDAEDVQDFKNSGKQCYIDHILKSNQPILGF